jgi:hypothetical protein
VKVSKINNGTYITRPQEEEFNRENSDAVPNPPPPPVKSRTKEIKNQRMNHKVNGQTEKIVPIEYSNVVVNDDRNDRYKGQVQVNTTRTTYIKQRSIESHETDSSFGFYQDKYVPEYMSNKHLRSPALEYFVDEQNSVYGRVKL